MLDYEFLYYGIALGPQNKLLPVDLDIWWFAPNSAGAPNVDPVVTEDLDYLGINSVVLEYEPGAPPWPRKQSKQEKETQEIGSGDEGEAEEGLDAMFAPGAPLVCPP